MLGDRHKVGLIRADSGFYDGEYLSWLEARKLTYPGEVWRLYRGRGDAENRIAELKHDFGINGFCLDSFYATEAAFRTVMLAYNLMSVFRQALLKAPKAVRLSTMRFQCFALGSWVGRSGRKKVQRISLPRQRRPWFDGLFASIGAFKAPWPIPT